MGFWWIGGDFSPWTINPSIVWSFQVSHDLSTPSSMLMPFSSPFPLLPHACVHAINAIQLSHIYIVPPSTAHSAFEQRNKPHFPCFASSPVSPITTAHPHNPPPGLAQGPPNRLLQPSVSLHQSLEPNSRNTSLRHRSPV